MIRHYFFGAVTYLVMLTIFRLSHINPVEGFVQIGFIQLMIMYSKVMYGD